MWPSSGALSGRALSRPLEGALRTSGNPEDIAALFDAIGEKRGCLMGGGMVDYDKTTEVIIRDIRTEKFGRLSFETPSE